MMTAIDNFTKELNKYKSNVRGARLLEREITDDLKPMFGDRPYVVMLCDSYEDDLERHEEGYATIWVFWLDKHDLLDGWFLLIKTHALHNRIVRAAITGEVGTCLNRYTRKPPAQKYGLIDQDEWANEVLWAARGLYDTDSRRRKELNKMVALYGLGPIPEHIKV